MLSNADDDRLGLTPRPVDTVDGLEANTLWDGLFHLSAYSASGSGSRADVGPTEMHTRHPGRV